MLLTFPLSSTFPLPLLQLWVHIETLPYRPLFMVQEVQQEFFGYDLDRPVLDLCVMVLVGLAYRAVAYLAMLRVASKAAGGLQR